MQLRVARLCLDCEELHDASKCPVCASETFAFLSKWVPAPERRAKARPPSAPQAAASATSRMLVGVGVLGAIAFAVNQWSRTARERLEAAASRQPTGELK